MPFCLSAAAQMRLSKYFSPVNGLVSHSSGADVILDTLGVALLLETPAAAPFDIPLLHAGVPEPCFIFPVLLSIVLTRLVNFCLLLVASFLFLPTDSNFNHYC